MQKYDWNAQDYEKHSLAQQKWARELMVKLNLEGGEDILDLGCGDGKVTAEIAECVPSGSVLGVDNSSSMVELAREKYPATHHPNVSFMLMDAANLSFKEEFDIVFSYAALHWVKDHKPVIQGLYQSLRPGGRILLQMGGKGNADGILAALEELQNSQVWKQYFSDFEFPYGFHGTEQYSDWLRKSGFDIKRVELIPRDMEQDGESGLAGWIRTTWLPFTHCIPDEQREGFIAELARKYIDQVPLDTNGKAHVAMVRLEVEAIK